jgi:hypothetical protein
MPGCLDNGLIIIPDLHLGGQLPVAPAYQMNQTAFKICPLPTSLFTGRDLLVQRGKDYLLGDMSIRKVFVVHGLGGIGKTQTALRIIEKTHNHWSDIVYGDATSVETIEATLKDFAVSKCIGDSHKDVLRWLSSHEERWLLLLDNAGHPSVDILEYIPQCSHGNILITTRNQELVDLSRAGLGLQRINHGTGRGVTITPQGIADGERGPDGARDASCEGTTRGMYSRVRSCSHSNLLLGLRLSTPGDCSSWKLHTQEPIHLCAVPRALSESA